MSRRSQVHAAPGLVAVLVAMLLAPLPAVAGDYDLADASPYLRAELSMIAGQKDISLQEAFERHLLRVRATPAIDIVAADPDHFADIFQDDNDGTWKLRILYVGELADAQARLSDALPADIPTKWEQVARNFAALSSIQTKIISAWTSVYHDRITEVSIDTLSNTVAVSSAEEDAALERDLRDAYGVAISFGLAPPDEVAACNATNDPEGGSRYACTPWRGGTAIQTWDQGYNNVCTSGLWARRKSNASSKQLMTAGHCGGLNLAAYNGAVTFYHNTFTIGTSIGSSFSEPIVSSDSRRIPSIGTSGFYNEVYQTPSNKEYPLDHVVSNGSQRLYDPVCKVGIGLQWFGMTCGLIVNANSTVYDDVADVVFTAKQGDFNGTCAFICDGWGTYQGDSGGPVIYNNGLFGLVTTAHGKYSLARNIEDGLSVWFCMNGNCTLP